LPARFPKAIFHCVSVESLRPNNEQTVMLESNSCKVFTGGVTPQQ
jgi:hypothetical protein